VALKLRATYQTMMWSRFASLIRGIALITLIITSAGAASARFGTQEPTGVQAAPPPSTPKPRPRNKRSSRATTSEAQQRLSELGYWVGEPNGKWGIAASHGLIAFQKVERRKRTGRLTATELKALRTATRPAPREQGVAHIEVDLQRQVLFVVEADGTVSRILPVSTGNGKSYPYEGDIATAVTPLGRFRVYRKIEGWKKSKLGLLYFPSYIVGGIAIHGNPSVPAQPASHGCIRIPMFAAIEFSRLIPVGTEVLVYGPAMPTAKSVSQAQQ
jgi:lipoprotein-anchoring transpeptidase ErfK/SrfK